MRDSDLFDSWKNGKKEEEIKRHKISTTYRKTKWKHWNQES